MLRRAERLDNSREMLRNLRETAEKNMSSRGRKVAAMHPNATQITNVEFRFIVQIYVHSEGKTIPIVEM